MSEWDQYEFDRKIVDILRSPQFRLARDHHFGRPYVTAYQIASAFGEAHPELCRQLNKVVTGTGVDAPGMESLPRYIARMLSQRIKRAQERGEFYPIEAAWLSAEMLASLRFKHAGTYLEGNPNSEHNGYTLFRLCEE